MGARWPFRFEAAKAAMQGLLSDPRDREDERLFHWEKSTKGKSAKVYDESCERCVARLAVLHADALLRELAK